MRRLHPQLVLLAGVVGIALGLSWLVRGHWELKALRVEIAVLRDEAGELAALQKRNERLRAQRVPDAEVARLRAEDAALRALRNEVERLKERASASGR